MLAAEWEASDLWRGWWNVRVMEFKESIWKSDMGCAAWLLRGIGFSRDWQARPPR
jgi:hypothetical protein